MSAGFFIVIKFVTCDTLAMTKQRSKRLTHIVVGLLLLCGTFYTVQIIRDGWLKMSFNPQARAEMKHLHSRLNLGQTKPQVKAIFNAGNYKKLEMGGSPKDSDWGVSTPFEFGSGNWVLLIDFNAQDRVSALKLRTIDSHQERPREPAPADKIAP